MKRLTPARQPRHYSNHVLDLWRWKIGEMKGTTRQAGKRSQREGVRGRMVLREIECDGLGGGGRFRERQRELTVMGGGREKVNQQSSRGSINILPSHSSF